MYDVFDMWPQFTSGRMDDRREGQQAVCLFVGLAFVDEIISRCIGDNAGHTSEMVDVAVGRVDDGGGVLSDDVARPDLHAYGGNVLIGGYEKTTGRRAGKGRHRHGTGGIGVRGSYSGLCPGTNGLCPE